MDKTGILKAGYMQGVLSSSRDCDYVQKRMCEESQIMCKLLS